MSYAQTDTWSIPTYTYGGIVGILSAQKDSNVEQLEPQNQRSIGVATERYNAFLCPCEVIDSEILVGTTNINDGKQTILDVQPGVAASFGTDGAAQTALDDLYGDTKVRNYPNSQNVGWANTSGIGSIFVPPLPVVSTFTEGDLVYEAGGAYGFVAFTTTASSVYLRSVVGLFTGGSISSITSGEPAPGDVTVGFATGIFSIGVASYHDDCSLIEYYGNLEPANADNDNPYGNYSSPILTSSNKGLGVGNTFFENAIDTGDGGLRMLNSLKGNVIAFSTSTYSSAYNTVVTQKNIIDEERIGVGSLTGSVNVMKESKTSFALEQWSYIRGNRILQDRNGALDSAIDVFDDPRFKDQCSPSY